MRDPLLQQFDDKTEDQLELSRKTPEQERELEQARKEWVEMSPLKRAATRHPLQSKGEWTSEIITMAIGVIILIAIVVLA